MAKTIDYKSFHVAICPYKVDGCKNEYNDLSVGVRYVKGKGFMVDYMPGWYYNGIGGCIFDYSDNPLTAGKRYLVQAAGKNNTKLLLSMYDNLSAGTATKIISYLFSQHDWNALAVALKTIALDATWATEERLNAMVSEGGSVMQRLWRDAKKAYPDYVLLFHCGDFYEAYEADAEVLGKVLGITVTKHKGDYTMAGFPRHALDVYLKKMIVAGYRVAICDRLAEPGHMKVQELVAPSAINNNNNSTTSNSNSTTMTQNVKGADLIGKTVIMGENIAKYTITAINGEMATTTFERQGLQPMTVPMRVKDLLDMVESGKAHVDEPISTDNTTKADDVEEVNAEDIKAEEPVAPKIIPIRQESKAEEPKTETKTAETIHEQPKAEQPKTAKKSGKKSSGKYSFTTYKTKKGKEGGEIQGFAEDDAIYSLDSDVILTLHASKTWRRDKKGNRIYCLLFGPRYREAAEQVCEALNEGAGFDDIKAIVDGRTAERAAKREEWKAKRAEYIANREAKAAAATATDTATDNATASEAPKAAVSKADVAGLGDFLRKVLEKDPAAMALAEKLMAAA